MNAALPREALGKTLKSKGRAVGKKYQRPFFSFSCVVLLPPPHHHPRLLPPRTNPFVVCSAVDCGRMLLCHSVTTDLREKDTTCEERAADDRTSREGGGSLGEQNVTHTKKCQASFGSSVTRSKRHPPTVRLSPRRTAGKV